MSPRGEGKEGGKEALRHLDFLVKDPTAAETLGKLRKIMGWGVLTGQETGYKPQINQEGSVAR